MKGSIAYENDRKSFCVWWYVPSKKRSVPLRYNYGIKLYDRELAKKLLALVQGTYEKAQRGECVFRIENFEKGASIDVVELFQSWLDTKKKMKPGGFATYQSHFRTWIRPFFLSHQIALHEITLHVLHKLKRAIEDLFTCDSSYTVDLKPDISIGMEGVGDLEGFAVKILIRRS